VEISNDPISVASSWSADCECFSCGTNNKDIRLDDLISPAKRGGALFKCEFCHEENYIRVPKQVGYLLSSNQEDIADNKFNTFIGCIAGVFILLTIFISGLTLKYRDSPRVIGLLALSNISALASGYVAALKDIE
jgi:hypothetical protein